jgi:Mor family transcriptional regulator
MSGARDLANDIVAAVCELFARMLAEYERDLLEQHGLPPLVDSARAARLVAEAEDELRDGWGGEKHYVPRASWVDRSGRDAAIRSDRARMSLGAIAVKYGLSKSHVKRICEEG